ncbi:MAG TPA: cytochrome c [Fimbriimonadaceae bacterium]|nr:cytochrome c [Fimbriimonadaceae bacterium]
MVSALVLMAVRFAQVPTYGEHIAPLFTRSCMPCHAPGGAGPFQLDTYQAVSRRLELIRTVTLSRQMPPHRATSEFGNVTPVPTLSDEELVLIQEWLKSGAKQGASEPQVDAKTGSVEVVRGRHEIKAPLVAEEGQPYWVTFRLNVDPTHLKVGGIKVTPKVPTVIRRVDVAMSRVTSSVEPVRSNGDFAFSEKPFLSWSAGYGQVLAPGHFELPKDGQIVVQVLYTPIGRKVSGDFVLEFLEGSGSRLSPVVIHEREFVVPSMKVAQLSRSITLDRDQVFGGVLTFGRKFAAEIKIEADIPNQETKSLLYIQHFNYLWVGSYVLPKPVHLPKGTTIRVTSTYDNTEHCTANVGRNIRPVRLGPGYDDEIYKFSLLMGEAE